MRKESEGVCTGQGWGSQDEPARSVRPWGLRKGFSTVSCNSSPARRLLETGGGQ